MRIGDVRLCGVVAISLWIQTYPAVAPLERTFLVPDVAQANVALNITSSSGEALYKLQCHTAGYTGDPDFDYSGDFECRLSPLYTAFRYSTYLTENEHQSRDWESRGRFFGESLRGACAGIPDFGATRRFRLRGMLLTLKIVNPVFRQDDSLSSLRLDVSVRPEPSATREIAARVLPPNTRTAEECGLRIAQPTRQVQIDRDLATKAVGCLAAQELSRPLLTDLGIHAGMTVDVRAQGGSIKGTSPSDPSSINLATYSRDKTRGWLMFVRRLRNGDLLVVHNAYLLRRDGRVWSASEGNGGIATYKAIGEYVTDMDKLPLMTVTVKPFSSGCRSEG